MTSHVKALRPKVFLAVAVELQLIVHHHSAILHVNGELLHL